MIGIFIYKRLAILLGGKMLEDIKKSVNKLVKDKNNKMATCISFTSFDPQPEEWFDCKEYCKKYECKYELYNNRLIAQLIDKKYPELIINLFEPKGNNELNKIQLLFSRYHEQIDHIISEIIWMDANT